VAALVLALLAADPAAAAFSFLAKWGTTGSGSTNFNTPWGLAVSSATGTIYVGDWANNRVQVLDSAGAFLGSWSGTTGVGTTGFLEVPGVAVDPATGNVYVTDQLHSRVEKLSATGAFLLTWGKGVNTTTGGDLCTAASGDNCQAGASSSADGAFDTPTGVAVDPRNGNVYVTDQTNYRLDKFTANGVFLRKWGKVAAGNPAAGTGALEFSLPKAVAVDPAGSVFIADSSNHRIQRMDKDGTFVTSFGKTNAGNPVAGNGLGEFTNPTGIAADPSGGTIYIADRNNNRVQTLMLGPPTTFGTFGTLGSGDGQFNAPQGVAVDCRGSVYVSDGNNDRVQKFGDPLNAAAPPCAKRSSATILACSPASVPPGSAATCTATVTDTDAGAKSDPSGSVSFSSDGSGGFGGSTSCSLIAAGAGQSSCQLTYTPSAVGTGAHKITAAYGGSTTHSASSDSRSVSVSSNPGGGGNPGGGNPGGSNPGGSGPPVLANLKLDPSTFPAANSGGSIAKKKPGNRKKRRVGTKVSYSDSEPATTTFTVLQPQPGIKQGPNCIKPPKRTAKGKGKGRRKPQRPRRCTRYVALGSFAHADSAGQNSFRFSGRVGRKKLSPGKYTLQALPRLGERRGSAALADFRVVSESV
jgi:DNA-binding beta-propeller fold protein YncE